MGLGERVFLASAALLTVVAVGWVLYAGATEPDCPKEQKTCNLVLMPQFIGKSMYMQPMEVCSCPEKK